MEKQEIKFNGFILWNSSYKGMVFARQLEPTEGLEPFDSMSNKALRTPIFVGRDGEYGRDLIEILEENEKLKKRVLELESFENERQKNEMVSLGYEIDDIRQRIKKNLVLKKLFKM